MRTHRSGARRARLATALLMLPAMLLTACDTEELLEVDIPGKVPEEALTDPALASTLVNGVIADVECAFDNYAGAAAVHSDEYFHASGNLTMRLWGQRRINADDSNFAQAGCPDWAYGLYTPLQTARFQAADVYNRVGEMNVPNGPALQATARAYGGYALVALGEGFCEMALDGGPLITPDAVLQMAETWFSDAITLAGQAGATAIQNMAYMGRARVRLDLGKYAEAASDAARIPAGFQAVASRDANDPSRYNTHFEWVAGPLGRHASVAPSFRNVTWKGVADPRVPVFTVNQAGFDGATIHYTHSKVTSRSSPVVMGSYEEAQLIVAEAAAQSGDLATARQIIDALHAAAGIPALDASDGATQDAMIRLVLEERRRELFSDGGHRLNDMLRYRGTPYAIPFLGEAGSDHPNGLDQFGAPYGDTTCFPLPTIEKRGNPNIGG